VRSLADLGITLRSSIDDDARNKETGKLYFDADKFEEAWNRDPEAVQKFFFDEREYLDSKGETVTANYGWAQKFTDVVNKLAGDADQVGKVNARLDTLTETIDRNDIRLAFMQERLDFKRNMYLKQFYAMEQAMARMSNDMSAVGNIANAWQQNYSSG
jgi:flagellar capping protein FliD